MNPTEPIIYTATMAKIYLDQGRLDQAETVYRHLQEQSPREAEFQKALEKIADLRRADAPERLVALLGQWIELVQAQRRLADLKRMHNQGKKEKP